MRIGALFIYCKVPFARVELPGVLFSPELKKMETGNFRTESSLPSTRNTTGHSLTTKFRFKSGIL
jgi:hypothetical protein